MDMLTRDDLKDLMLRHPGWHVSLFMPAQPPGGDSEQDRIRFRNLLRDAEVRLVDKGLRSPVARKMLAPAQRLLDDSAFWRAQSDGLALFIADGYLRYFRLPLQFDEFLVVSEFFHLKPLLPFFTSEGHFYLLALSQKQVRLLEGTQHTVEELNLEGLPQSMADALNLDRFERQTQFHTRTSAGVSGARGAVFHGHDPSEEHKTRILQWFRKIDDELPQVLTSQKSPLVLAGVEFLFPMYREASSYPLLVEEGVPGNPEDLHPRDLHAQAWPLVQPLFRQAQERAYAQYRQLAGTGRTTSDVREALVAAAHGRVEDLFVAAGMQVWGLYDTETGAVQVHEDAQTGDQDLLDLAAIWCLINGGTVYAVSRDEMPDSSFLAAVFRY